MTKNPVINALAAFGYIALVVTVLGFAENHFDNKPSLLAPMAFMSLFTLSAAVMGYIFGLQPFQMYFEGKKKEAVKLVVQTIIGFGVITALVMGVVLSGVGLNF